MHKTTAVPVAAPAAVAVKNGNGNGRRIYLVIISSLLSLITGGLLYIAVQLGSVVRLVERHDERLEDQEARLVKVETFKDEASPVLARMDERLAWLVRQNGWKEDRGHRTEPR